MKSNVDLVAVDGVSSDNLKMYTVIYPLASAVIAWDTASSTVQCSIIYIVISIQNLVVAVVVSCVKFTTMSLRCCSHYTGAGAGADAIVTRCY